MPDIRNRATLFVESGFFMSFQKAIRLLIFTDSIQEVNR